MLILAYNEKLANDVVSAGNIDSRPRVDLKKSRVVVALSVWNVWVASCVPGHPGLLVWY
jgi:hypothetical protein